MTFFFLKICYLESVVVQILKDKYTRLRGCWLLCVKVTLGMWKTASVHESVPACDGQYVPGV